MNKKGVTLFELIVVFVIIAIGAVLVVPNLRPWILNYRLRSTTRDITSNLRTAQMRAATLFWNWPVLDLTDIVKIMPDLQVPPTSLHSRLIFKLADYG